MLAGLSDPEKMAEMMAQILPLEELEIHVKLGQNLEKNIRRWYDITSGREGRPPFALDNWDRAAIAAILGASLDELRDFSM